MPSRAWESGYDNRRTDRANWDSACFLRRRGGGRLRQLRLDIYFGFFSAIDRHFRFYLVPIEYVFAQLNMRWFAWFAIPLLGAAWPFLQVLLERKPNFPPGTRTFALELACAGVSWSLASLMALRFARPLPPDKRFFG